MKKHFILTLVVIIIITGYSCESEKLMSNEDYLCNGDWTIQQTETFYYYDDVFDRSEISINDKDIKIDFQKNGIVYYETPELIEVLQGTWQFDSTGEYLITDLHITLSGYSSIYLFYPRSKIIELNSNNLILESIPTTFTYISGETRIKIMSYDKCTCVKK
jgi:hypothetical protein